MIVKMMDGLLFTKNLYAGSYKHGPFSAFSKYCCEFSSINPSQDKASISSFFWNKI